jgi:uncharacterized membrane protein YcaP (DUF421 family)
MIKIAKHLAVVACLLILGRAAGQFHISQLTIFALIVLAAIGHSSGKTCLALARPKQS